MLKSKITMCVLLAVLFCLGCDDPAECRFIAFGDKPCGGPWSYLIYSSSNVDSVALGELVAEYNQYNEEINRRYNLMSDCSVPNEPNLGCLGGRCTDLGIWLPKKNMGTND